MFNLTTPPFGREPEDNSLLKMSYGAMSPLWAPFLLVAGVGVSFWMLTSFARRSFAAEMPGAALGLRASSGEGRASPDTSGAAAGPEHSGVSAPAAEPNLDPSKLDRPGQFMDHNVPPAEAGRSEPEDTNPPPPVPAEEVMDHTPPETVDMPGNPEVERRIAEARPADSADLGEEPGGEAALVGETSAALVGGTGNFGGDMRADEAAEPSPVLEDPTDDGVSAESGITPADLDDMAPPVPAEDAEADVSPTDASDDGADMVDAAYAANFGPVVAPETGGGAAPAGGPPKATRSRKGKRAPGTPPGA